MNGSRTRAGLRWLCLVGGLVLAGCSGGAQAVGTVGAYGLHTEPGLLATLPGTVDGEAVVESADLELPALADPGLAASADGYVGAYVGGLSQPDWAAVAVIRLRPASRTDAFYAAWRSEYDAAACSQAGGVADRRQEDLHGRTVDETDCSGGPVAYHLRLPGGILVSVTELGPRRLGRQLMTAIP